MKFFKLAALVAAMTTASVSASDLHAQAVSEQTRDESGAVTLQRSQRHLRGQDTQVKTHVKKQVGDAVGIGAQLAVPHA